MGYINDLETGKSVQFTQKHNLERKSSFRKLAESPLARNPTIGFKKTTSQEPETPSSPFKRSVKVKRAESNRKLIIDQLDNHLEKIEHPFNMNKLVD